MKEIKEAARLAVIGLIAGFSITLGICGCMLLINATFEVVFS